MMYGSRRSGTCDIETVIYRIRNERVHSQPSVRTVAFTGFTCRTYCTSRSKPKLVINTFSTLSRVKIKSILISYNCLCTIFCGFSVLRVCLVAYLVVLRFLCDNLINLAVPRAHGDGHVYMYVCSLDLSSDSICSIFGLLFNFQLISGGCLYFLSSRFIADYLLLIFRDHVERSGGHVSFARDGMSGYLYLDISNQGWSDQCDILCNDTNLAFLVNIFIRKF